MKSRINVTIINHPNNISRSFSGPVLQLLLSVKWHDSPSMTVNSADPIVREGTSLNKMLNEAEALLTNDGYTLKSTAECNGEILYFC